MNKIYAAWQSSQWWNFWPTTLGGWLFGVVGSIVAILAVPSIPEVSFANGPKASRTIARVSGALIAVACVWTSMNSQHTVHLVVDGEITTFIVGLLAMAANVAVAAFVISVVCFVIWVCSLPFTVKARAAAREQARAQAETERQQAEAQAEADLRARQDFYRTHKVFGTAGGSVSGTVDKFGAGRARYGQRGEEVVGRRLESLVAERRNAWLFHDLAWPPAAGTRANVDHAVVCGSQLLLIDAKRWAPGVFTTDVNGFAYRDGKPFPAGDKDVMAAAREGLRGDGGDADGKRTA